MPLCQCCRVVHYILRFGRTSAWFRLLFFFKKKKNQFLIFPRSFPLQMMTPLWVMPAYPLLLAAPLAANLIDAVPTEADAIRINSLALALGAITLQGAGFLVSFTINTAFIYRLMTQKLPKESLRPGVVGRGKASCNAS